MNYFTILPSEACESLFEDIPFAAITGRKHERVFRKKYDEKYRTYYDNIFHVLCNDHDSLETNNYFTMLYNVIATPIAFIAYSNKDSINPIPLDDHKDNSTNNRLRPYRLTMHALERQKEIIHCIKACREVIHPYYTEEALTRVKAVVYK